MKKEIEAVIGIVVAFFLLGFGIGSSRSAPPNALIFVNLADHTYLSFPCLAKKKDLRFILFDESGNDEPQAIGNISQRQLVQYRDDGTRFSIQAGITPDATNSYATLSYSSLEKVKKSLGKLNPDPDCRDQGGFLQDDRPMSGMLLEWFGLLSPLKSRWSPDGTWNW